MKYYEEEERKIKKIKQHNNNNAPMMTNGRMVKIFGGKQKTERVNERETKKI